MKTVVFVDDSKTVLLTAQQAMKSLIDNGNVEFKTFENPLELLDGVKSGEIRYDLLITDINMPQMNGLDMAKELKTMENTKTKPILALTTENGTAIKQQGKEIGLAGWITKPFSPEKLVMGVKRVLRIK